MVLMTLMILPEVMMMMMIDDDDGDDITILMVMMMMVIMMMMMMVMMMMFKNDDDNDDDDDRTMMMMVLFMEFVVTGVWLKPFILFLPMPCQLQPVIFRTRGHYCNCQRTLDFRHYPSLPHPEGSSTSCLKHFTCSAVNLSFLKKTM